jgi:hypothetical protein
MMAGKLISMPERDFITELAKEPQKSLGYIIQNLAARDSCLAWVGDDEFKPACTSNQTLSL